MKKKLTCCTLSLILLFLAAAVAGGSAHTVEMTDQEPLVFADVAAGFWAKPAIDNWSGRGVIRGSGQNFRPNAPITRAEMTVILGKIFGCDGTADNPFADIKQSDWFYNDVVGAYARGILQGDFDGNGNRLARPNDALTRAEAAALFSRIFSVPGNTGNQTKFADTLPGWAKESIYGMEAAGYVGGFNGLYHPANNLTRAEAVQMLDNIVKLYVYRPGSYSGRISGNVIVNTADTVLRNMNISGNLYLAGGIGEGALGLENVIVTGSTYIRGGGAGKIKTANCDLGTTVIEKEGIDLEQQTEAQPRPSSTPAANSGGSGGSGGSGESGGSNDPKDPAGPDDPGGGEIIDN